MSEVYVGLDLSLTSAGVAVRREPLASVGPAWWELQTVKSKAVGRGASPAAMSRRIELHARSIVELVPPGVPVAVEGPSHGSKFGSPHERAGLMWSVVARLRAKSCGIVVIPPTSAKLFFSGNGAAGKDDMISAAGRWFPDAQPKNDDEADAVALAAMLGHRLGRKIFPLTKAQRDSYDKLSWIGIEEEGSHP